MNRRKFMFDNNTDTLFDLHNRRRVLKFIVLVALLTFIPLSIKNFVIGETFLAILLLSFLLSLLIEVYAVLYLHKSLLGYSVPLALISFSIILSVDIFGTLATYWVFPVITAVVFIIPQRYAIVVNSIIIFGTTIVASQHQISSITLRFFLALLCCAFISHFAIAAIRKLQHELRNLSTKDSLTGAFNRYQLETFLQNAADRKMPNQQSRVQNSIAILDIDYFKQVNDLYGHDVGDQIIKEVVNTIMANTRKNDTLFRLGGDEFLLLLIDTSKNEASDIVQHFSSLISEGRNSAPFKINLSIGIAELVANEEIDTWMKRADIALYVAKNNGRNQVHIDNTTCPSDQATSLGH
ncbi:GGDEF domain-containing protein [Vibrio sp. 99-70-13A1]|uniref:GGDEF domain-containing protein n=1 Tax=Vibrio sp. 99-70-13A1 TaxID=2607601 RepID=UPI00149363A3|nr:GGDEF domain-containing protein [Vibrio sp. 99-70-13A1]NOH97592.1 GGDEF domain-containing protein [Vibrio sp. 99-70-13A1]